MENVLDYLINKGYLPSSTNLAEAISLLGAGKRVIEIVQDALDGFYKLEDEDMRLPLEAIAFHTAIILMGRIGGKWLVNRLSISVSKSMREELNFLSDQDLVLLSKLLGLHTFYQDATITRSQKSGPSLLYPFSVSFYSYLKSTKRLTGDPSWKLTNQMLLKGRVLLDRRRFIRIIEELIAERISSLYEKYADLMKLPSLPPPIQEIEAYLKESLANVLSKKIVEGRDYAKNQPLSIDAFPPCMKKIYQKAIEGENLSHAERFAIATFMIAAGADEEMLLEVFSHSPDYKEKIAKYQIEHLMGKRGSGTKYRPYSCAKMKSFSLCIADCGTRTPLQKYYLNLKVKNKVEDQSGSI
ncbi:MAG: hypothetical protein RXO29_02780 [Desulfurococcales archaeon]